MNDYDELDDEWERDTWEPVDLDNLSRAILSRARGLGG